jgi:hypothetical protein
MRKTDWNGTDFDFAKANDREELLSNKDFTFGHYKVGPGYATIGGARIGDELYYSVTFCSPEDNFSKAEGRLNVYDRLCEPEYGHLRGVLRLLEAEDDTPPAIILKRAVEVHLTKMRSDKKPQWTKGATVEFRGKRRTVGEVADWSGLQ